MVAVYQPGEIIYAGRPRQGVRLGGGGGASFVGPYDNIPSIAAAYGMRRLRTAYTGNLLRLRRSSDNAESDFGYVANGDLDAAAIATWLGGNNGLVTTWYDQSGNSRNATQSTAGNQPLYVASGQNGKPIARFDGSNDCMDFTAFTSRPLSLLGVAKRSSGGESVIIGDNASVSHFLAFGSGATLLLRVNGTTSSGAYGGGFVVATGLVPSSNSQALYGNGALLDSDAVGASIRISRLGSGNLSPLNGDLAEAIIADALWIGADRAAAEAAANLYWSVY